MQVAVVASQTDLLLFSWDAVNREFSDGKTDGNDHCGWAWTQVILLKTHSTKANHQKVLKNCICLQSGTNTSLASGKRANHGDSISAARRGKSTSEFKTLWKCRHKKKKETRQFHRRCRDTLSVFLSPCYTTTHLPSRLFLQSSPTLSLSLLVFWFQCVWRRRQRGGAIVMWVMVPITVVHVL